VLILEQIKEEPEPASASSGHQNRLAGSSGSGQKDIVHLSPLDFSAISGTSHQQDLSPADLTKALSDQMSALEATIIQNATRLSNISGMPTVPSPKIAPNSIHSTSEDNLRNTGQNNNSTANNINNNLVVDLTMGSGIRGSDIQVPSTQPLAREEETSETIPTKSSFADEEGGYFIHDLNSDDLSVHFAAKKPNSIPKHTEVLAAFKPGKPVVAFKQKKLESMGNYGYSVTNAWKKFFDFALNEYQASRICIFTDDHINVKILTKKTNTVKDVSINSDFETDITNIQAVACIDISPMSARVGNEIGGVYPDIEDFEYDVKKQDGEVVEITVDEEAVRRGLADIAARGNSPFGARSVESRMPPKQ